MQRLQHRICANNGSLKSVWVWGIMTYSLFSALTRSGLGWSPASYHSTYSYERLQYHTRRPNFQFYCFGANVVWRIGFTNLSINLWNPHIFMPSSSVYLHRWHEEISWLLSPASCACCCSSPTLLFVSLVFRSSWAMSCCFPLHTKQLPFFGLSLCQLVSHQ